MFILIGQLYCQDTYGVTAVMEFPEVPAIGQINLSYASSEPGKWDYHYSAGHITSYGYLDEHNQKQWMFFDPKHPSAPIFDYVSIVAHPRMTSVEFQLDGSCCTANAMLNALPGQVVRQFPEYY